MRPMGHIVFGRVTATGHIVFGGTLVRRLWRRRLVLGAIATRACANPPATTCPIAVSDLVAAS
jgi:hypothetical protein